MTLSTEISARNVANGRIARWWKSGRGLEVDHGIVSRKETNVNSLWEDHELDFGTVEPKMQVGLRLQTQLAPGHIC